MDGTEAGALPTASPVCDAPPASSFPLTREDFKSDPRVSWSRLIGKWTLEAEDGAEYEYEEGLKRWVPVLDESLAMQQQAAYAVAGVDESEPAVPINKKKRKVYTSNEPSEEASSFKKARNGKRKGDKDVNPRKNTAVYVTNLPDDVTEEEIKSVFSKCGMIAEEIDGGKSRIKLYRHEDGTLKGDALVIYFRPESVDLAIQMLDDTDIRFGNPSPNGRMKVQAADLSYKVQKEVPVTKSNKDQRKVIAKTQKLNSKLADWDDDDPSTLHETNSRWDKVVILKHMFTLQELEDDPTTLLDLKEDIREECEKLGDVTNVVLYDKEEQGVVSVRFANSESAKACVTLMDGRFFAGQKVEAYIFDGIQKFKKSNPKQEGEDSAKAEEERLEKFGSWLEAEANEE
ncbi:hypothetical protein RUND412_011320 [Rhizina undulata]